MILEIICLCGKKISESIRDSKIYLCQKSGRGQWPKDIKRLQEGWWVTMENPVYGKIIWLGLKFRLNRRVDRSEWFKIPLLIFFLLCYSIPCSRITLHLFFFFVWKDAGSFLNVHSHRKLSHQVCKTLKFVEIAISGLGKKSK